MEDRPSQENIPAAQVAEELRTKGIDNPEVRTLLFAWLDQTEKAVKRGEMTNLERNVAWAELYRDAGFMQQAIEAFSDTAEEAFQTRNEKILKYCEGELRKLRE